MKRVERSLVEDLSAPRAFLAPQIQIRDLRTSMMVFEKGCDNAAASISRVRR